MYNYAEENTLSFHFKNANVLEDGPKSDTMKTVPCIFQGIVIEKKTESHKQFQYYWPHN